MTPIRGLAAKIQDNFWSPRLEVNASAAITHQLDQLEASGCLENFRVAAGDKPGVHEGWFFADSDAFKWLDAAANVYAGWPSEALKKQMDQVIDLFRRAQAPDGYLYTYNQLNFPGSRWENLMIEHELYCHGHLIEAGVSHYEACADSRMLDVAIRAADLLVEEFLTDDRPARTSGHEEIEVALLRLSQVTGKAIYRDLAASFLERRGRARPFLLTILPQRSRTDVRRKEVEEKRKVYRAAHPEHSVFKVPAGNFAKESRFSRLRWTLSGMTGKYFQMHAPIRKQTVPVGHSVRFGYLETAVAMLAGLTGDRSLLPAMEKAWDRMVSRRMYVTGGIGSVPGVEGFGRDYELDPEYAYAETCAALACLFWNWEMGLLTSQPCYSELFEWQLYNAAGVGMGLGGNDYLYNNPLTCRQGVTRKPWFAVPCCPSNLSRTFARLGKYLCSSDDANIWIHQYIGSTVQLGEGFRLEINSELPWTGQAIIRFHLDAPIERSLQLRAPLWASGVKFRINGQPHPIDLPAALGGRSAGGYDPRPARFLPLDRVWSDGDELKIDWDMPIITRRASPRVHGHKGKITLTRGPLVFCLESTDNPDIDIFSEQLDPSSLKTEFSPTLLQGTQVILGRAVSGQPLVFIPYFLWANRGESQMTVWIKALTNRNYVL